MPNKITIFFFLSIFFLSNFAQVVTDFELPCLAWSGKDYLSQKQAIVHTPFEPVEFSGFLEAFLTKQVNKGGSAFAPVVKSLPTSPEVVVVFVQPKLRVDELKRTEFESLQRIMAESRTSFIAPHGRLRSSSASMVGLALNTATKYHDAHRVVLSNLPYYSDPNAELVSIDNLLAFLGSDSILSNGNLDVLFVGVDFQVIDDGLIERVTEILQDRTDGNFVAMFVSEKPSIPAVTWKFEPRYARFFSEESPTISPNTTSHHNWFRDHFPGWFWEAFITSVILIFITFVGIWMMAALQTPDQWEVPKKRRQQYD